MVSRQSVTTEYEQCERIDSPTDTRSDAAANRRLSAQEAAEFLGVSARWVYDHAAPNGPIPCFRMGGRLVFDRSDLSEYLQSCRYTKTQRSVVTSLSSTPILRSGESEFEKFCRENGLKPRLTPPKRKV